MNRSPPTASITVQNKLYLPQEQSHRYYGRMSQINIQFSHGQVTFRKPNQWTVKTLIHKRALNFTEKKWIFYILGNTFKFIVNPFPV
ncbi:hypothetical protein AQUCO_00700092v1 [Aquilegia coerulea]|uniref:Uncharacterized protein n=1 Tax=Aquilegia coerulea TaxID=218851 RepID=A0A2G5EIK0_AQUCA|nr:hypothetical protein AQUCO_00700092v1 [Aquilegia coerulea]